MYYTKPADTTKNKLKPKSCIIPIIEFFCPAFSFGFTRLHMTNHQTLHTTDTNDLRQNFGSQRPRLESDAITNNRQTSGGSHVCADKGSRGLICSCFWMQISQIVSHLPVWQIRQTNTEKKKNQCSRGKNSQLRKDLRLPQRRWRWGRSDITQLPRKRAEKSFNQVQAITAQVNPGTESSRGCREAPFKLWHSLKTARVE